MSGLGLSLNAVMIWHKSKFVNPLLTKVRPTKDIEAICIYSFGGRLNFYNVYSMVDEITEFKYAYWCRSAKEVSDAKLMDDYSKALEEVLKGNKEYLEHVRFSSNLKSSQRKDKLWKDENRRLIEVFAEVIGYR